MRQTVKGAREVQRQSGWETEMREIHAGSSGSTRYAVSLGDQWGPQRI